MLIFLSKILPIFIYPLGLACVLLIVVLLTKRWPRWQRIGILLALAVLWIGGNHWVATGLARSLEWRYLPLDQIPEADVIVVLGGGTQAAIAPRPIVEVNGAGDRVIYGAWLYHQSLAEQILVSGGRIPWLSAGLSEKDTPAHEMAFLLEMLGVPEGAIWLEPDSLNTYENAVYSSKILKNKGVDRIILVTSAIHMPRSVKLFEAQGIEVIPAPVDYRVTKTDLAAAGGFDVLNFILRLLPGADNLTLTTKVMKEYIGMLFYNLRGWE
jgi:uncharacterized SAM-binding protein YcdF (DUF218 family)